MGAAAAGGIAVSSSGAAEDKTAGFSFSRKLPVCKPYEVVVCGGGPSGITAALAAARAGGSRTS